MKNSSIWLFVIFFIGLFHTASAQTVTKELSPGYYVVVGAYAATKEENAKHFVEVLIQRGHEADYGFNTSRNLYFVYINYFTTLKASIEKMEAVRASKKFVDAWVRVVPGYVKMDEQKKNETTVTSTADNKQQVDPSKTPDEKSNTNISNTIPVENDSSTTDVKDNEPIKQFPKMTLGNTEVFLSLYNARNNRIVDGEVQVIDTERARQITKVKGNEYLILPDPKSKSGQLTLVCDVFGYRKIQQEINYPLPLADTVKPYVELWGTSLVVTFDLMRYHIGDIAVLYNVYFYKDAAIMMPESKFELNNLLAMMKENPNYRISLNGHTNGNQSGKIIIMGASRDFFSLADGIESGGSAKELSERRAEIIKDWLVANGVDGSRIEVKGWGGKKPIYETKSVNAGKNVRVEVEMLAE
jgi:outer membrane protein OmpA-like peptidoglycan-associated protein